MPSAPARRCTSCTWRPVAAVEALAEWRARGLPFYGETLSTYLSFTQDDIWDESPIEVDGKTYNARGLLVNNYPTPKFGPDRDTCWEAIADDRLQVVATDHARREASPTASR